ncbi:MAG: nucleotidyltransferase family protein [Rhodopirellula sp.]|nr:nucleotidyltransferase family protein [Rhodopirellula sp.]
MLYPASWINGRRIAVKPTIPREAIAEFCERHHIRRLALFGSVLRDDFGPHSDIDALVEWEPGHTPGWEIVDIAEELERLFDGRKVELINPQFLKPRLRDNVLKTAEVQYERAG